MLGQLKKKPIDAPSQEQLISKAQKGDEEALIELICGVYANLSHTINFNTAHKDDIRCCMLLGVWKALLFFDATKGVPFVGYASKVSYNEIITFCRKHSITPLSLDKLNEQGSALLDSISDENKPISEIEEREDVLSALLKLTPQHRLVIYYRFIEGLDRQQTARNMRINLSKLKRIQSEAISEMRRLLK